MSISSVFRSTSMRRLNSAWKRSRDKSGPVLVKTRLPGFDPIYYLYWYPDVRAAGMDPLYHYLVCGWQEGRDPSAGFSTDGYLRANADLIDEKINPLLHFIECGLAEGRRGWEKDPQSPAPRPRAALGSVKLLTRPKEGSSE